MLPMGIWGYQADQNYLLGLRTGNVIYFSEALKQFPYERAIVTGLAELRITQQIYDKDTYLITKSALGYDPYSARLLGMHMQFEYVFGNKNEAFVAYNKLKMIAPNSNVLNNSALNTFAAKGY